MRPLISDCEASQVPNPSGGRIGVMVWPALQREGSFFSATPQGRFRRNQTRTDTVGM
jgi:hypothetical protein